jgi:hypothetical protein
MKRATPKAYTVGLLLFMPTLGCPNTDCTSLYQISIEGLPTEISELSILFEFENQTVDFICAEETADGVLNCMVFAGPWYVNAGFRLGADALLELYIGGVDDVALAPRGDYRLVLTSPEDPDFRVEYLSEFTLRVSPPRSICKVGQDVWHADEG